MKNLIIKTVAVIILFVCSVRSLTADTGSQAIGQWLILGPVPVSKPVFHEKKSSKSEYYTVKELLQQQILDIGDLSPSEGKAYRDVSGGLLWKKNVIDTSGSIRFQGESGRYELFYAAAYVEVRRWMKVKIELSGYHPFQFFVDGKLISAKSASDDTSKKTPGKLEPELKFETGKHLLVVKYLVDKDLAQPAGLRGAFTGIADSLKNDFILSVDPAGGMSVGHLLDLPRITQMIITPDGEWAAVSLSRSAGDQTESWIEIRRTSDGSLVQTFRGGLSMYQAQWAPAGKRLSYMTYSNQETTLWIMDFSAGQTKAVLEKVKNFSRYMWSPDGDNIIYEQYEKSESPKTGLKKSDGLKNRSEGSSVTHIYRLNTSTGIMNRLTAGPLPAYFQSVSPDGKRMIFTRNAENLTRRPYTDTYVSVLDLETMTADSLWTLSWFSQAQWSPDGNQILMTGGPSLFGTLGINLPDKKMIPNDYDNQAYIYDLKTKEIKCISLNFNPSIDNAVWNSADGYIYLETTDRSFSNLYRYNPRDGKFSLIETGVDAVSGFDLAGNALKGVYYGSGTSNPQKGYSLDLSSLKYQVVCDPAKSEYQTVRFGIVKPWTFRNKNKTEIDGYVHYPPGFDSTKSYPCIVYYYGGTSPVTRDFGGRYPKEFYAANGYIVYTLQPSGAKGYGQAFSAAHVNNWGMTVADEIIDGAKKFLDAHPFVDKKRVGCIGASYGGFMTMLLTTKTDMFATAISHAGISSISSYWGEGYWGYSYSAMATANSFPWNRKDIYVNQSPLFSADKIKTPLLLLHGASDTNVPVGESIQLYTALKLLNRPVELIQVDDQDHHIMQYSKRMLWTKTILAWFDRWLKDQPDWWNELYPEK